MAPEDITAWVKGLDDATEPASRTVAEVSMEKLRLVLAALGGTGGNAD